MILQQRRAPPRGSPMRYISSPPSAASGMNFTPKSSGMTAQIPNVNRLAIRALDSLGRAGRMVVMRVGQPTPEGAIPVDDMTLEQADAAVAAAVAKAQQIGAKMNIAVVDAGANLKAFARMDGAWLGSIDIAIRKARTARFFDMNTGEVGKLSQPGGSLFAIEHSNGGLITFPGGVPIKNAAGHVIGAIGVSGNTVENDNHVAEAGAAAVK